MKPRRAGCLGFVLGFSLVVGGCAYEGLVPAPRAKVVPTVKRMAYDRTTGVTVFVDGDAWRGEPSDLTAVMTPIWVSVENHSGDAVRISYRDFSLEMPTGLRAAPLAPFTISSAGPLRSSMVSASRFRYPGSYVTWRVPLPTEDMLRAALPEGVLEPGGRVSGYLYFPDVPENTRGELGFRAELVKEGDGDKLASVDIPLVVK